MRPRPCDASAELFSEKFGNGIFTSSIKPAESVPCDSALRLIPLAIIDEINIIKIQKAKVALLGNLHRWLLDLIWPFFVLFC